MLIGLVVALVTGMSVSATMPRSLQEFHANELGKLAHQLDCMSMVLQHCSREAYVDLWQRSLAWNAGVDVF